MALAAKMPNGTRVKHNDGRTGKTVEWLPGVGAMGGYRVQWDDDASVEQVLCHQMSPEGGSVSTADYNDAVARITKKLGGYEAKYEGAWLHQGKKVESVLIVSKPAHLGVGEEMHAHASMGGGIKKAHVKRGNDYVRSVYQDGAYTAQATAKDKEWCDQIRIRNSLMSSKQKYMSGQLALPK